MGVVIASRTGPRRGVPRALTEVRPSGTTTADARPARPPEVALLAATAIGYAVTSGPTATNVAILASLVEHDPEALLAARDAVADVEIASAAERRTAADLLTRAASGWPA
jgi:hypothetical protein